MVGYLDLGRPLEELRTPLESLPVTVTRRTDPLRAQLICGFALFFGIMPLIVLAAEGDRINWDPAWTAWVFPLAATAMFLFGFREWRWRRTITIAKDRVAVAERGLFGSEVWEEPLADYQGVMAYQKDVWRRGSLGHKEKTTVYLVDIHHAVDARSVTLFASAREQDWRETWQSAARCLGLRAI